VGIDLTLGSEVEQSWLPAEWEAIAVELSALMAEAYQAHAPIPLEERDIPALDDNGRGYEALPSLWRLILDGSARLGSPTMVGHMDHAPHPSGALTDALVSALNNNLLFRELSPFASRIEETLIEEFSRQLGLSTDTPGIFASGGSLANLTGLFAATGGYAPKIARSEIALFLPDGAHSSIGKAAAILGLSPDLTIAVPVDEAGRMDGAALDERLSQTVAPLKIVVAIMGGTVTGSVDPIAAIADVADAHGAWLHVDGIYGGALAYSHRYRDSLTGIERAHSISIGPQKWMFAPRLCALCLFPGCVDFDARLGVKMPYSARGGDHRGTWGLQGSRRADVLPLWVVMQVLGRRRLGALVDAQNDLARWFHQRLIDHPVAAPVHTPDLNLQAFRWGAPDLDGDRVLALQQGLERMGVPGGAPWVSVSRWQGEFVLRTVLLNPRTDQSILNRLLDSLEQIA